MVVALAGSVIGAGHTRKRRDLPRAWWLRFWTSRAGGWAARLAGLGLGLGKTGSGERGTAHGEQGTGNGEREGAI